MTEQDRPRVVAVTRGAEQSGAQGPSRGPQHERLNVWVGRWINEGHMVEADGTSGMAITTSDVYEWLPGRFFILHTAYGRIGDFGVGGAEAPPTRTPASAPSRPPPSPSTTAPGATQRHDLRDQPTKAASSPASPRIGHYALGHLAPMAQLSAERIGDLRGFVARRPTVPITLRDKSSRKRPLVPRRACSNGACM
jgi:hypothetical protein